MTHNIDQQKNMRIKYLYIYNIIYIIIIFHFKKKFYDRIKKGNADCVDHFSRKEKRFSGLKYSPPTTAERVQSSEHVDTHTTPLLVSNCFDC